MGSDGVSIIFGMPFGMYDSMSFVSDNKTMYYCTANGRSKYIMYDMV